MSLGERLCAHIEQELLDGAAPGTIGVNDSLIRRGVLDSMAVLELVSWLEEQTGLRISDQDVQLEHFDTVAAMLELVERLRARVRG